VAQSVTFSFLSYSYSLKQAIKIQIFVLSATRTVQKFGFGLQL